MATNTTTPNTPSEQPQAAAPNDLGQAAAELAAALAAAGGTPPAPAGEQTPVAAPEPQTWEQKDLGDGKFEIRLNTGEVYQGNPQELMVKLAQSSANTHNYARDLKQKVQKYESAAPKAPELAPIAGQPEPAIDPAVKLLADMQAQYLGFANGEEMKQAYQRMQQTQEQIQGQQIANAFYSQNPDFPVSPRNAEVLGQFIEQNGLSYNPTHMALAHQHLKAVNAYDPVSIQNQQQQFQRPAPPPMAPMPGSALPTGNNMIKPESMSLEDLGTLLAQERRRVQ